MLLCASHSKSQFERQGETMRKLSLFTLTAATMIAAVSPALTSQAKVCNADNSYLKNDNCIVIGQTVNGSCNLEEVLAQLEKEFGNNSWNNCFSNITLGDCNTSGDKTDKPETETPGGTDKPETEAPGETDKPETDSPKQEETEQSTYAQQILALVNQERTKAGLKEVALEEKLGDAANVRAKESATSFSHTRPDGSSFATVLKEKGVTYTGAGENIAWGQKSPEEVMKGWMNSSGHRANILNPKFTTLGVGHYQDSKGTNYWAQLFIY